jgi:hypothetical protein
MYACVLTKVTDGMEINNEIEEAYSLTRDRAIYK